MYGYESTLNEPIIEWLLLTLFIQFVGIEYRKYVASPTSSSKR